ncbi:class I SAM-dependent methyltransferase [Mesorhizobium sp. NZP2077]|uniref:class I SAM-dependent methyltransferase n=1 Tax=Mesorhizobium sp. NZP2077 TaxID=2483404 RepID=UPI001555F062|nr:class I SAM-dependent methyltransferase [Mesorhizobium sp. NZP2077]QKC85271.1 class I SAM-dependent methyltransferase [Mesorhizobium sp. NZP2077]QKD18911.1 class I SAM-dependent methyltransferase [Mesorhizobium sp. NZP2077]
MDIDNSSTNDDADHSAAICGENYSTFLNTLHLCLKPKTYFEIGTLSGGTLRLANGASIAVDPQFQIDADIMGVKPSCMLFQQSSDEFFATHNASQLFGAPIDLAFLDGMHLFEFLLRDFMNTEKHCRKNSIILLHDCLPPGFFMTVRDRSDPTWAKSRFARWWTGDVWKVIPVLRSYRPDLSITMFDCPPTGLVSITNLDPASQALDSAYVEIVDRFSSKDIDREAYDNYWTTLSIEKSREFSTAQHFATKFWI